MMLSLTNPEIVSANDGVLNVEAKHDNQIKFIVGSNRKATFPLSNQVELLDLSIERFLQAQATPHNQRRSGPPLLPARAGIVHIQFTAANNTRVSSRVLHLYFALNFFYSYPIFLIKPKAATKLEITVSNIDASVTLHSRLLVKSEGE
ncbi:MULTISPECIES: hypothetical protein [Vibrio]|uniref:hypothetical protein n=1 Tax=Vibrio TaxID=662 RepID=UPI000C8679C8|nr:hypothetical protein [Vibrio tasmaniensis]PMO79730.1 hypothetical protein BCT01_10270 [Vibrio tasmaniensis]